MQRWTLKKIPSLLPSCIIQCQHGRNGDKFKVNMWPSVPRCVSQVTIIPSPFIYIFTNYCFECKTIFNSPGIMECHSSQTYIFIYFFFHFAYEINFWSKKKKCSSESKKRNVHKYIEGFFDRVTRPICCHFIDPIGECAPLCFVCVLVNLFVLVSTGQHGFFF